MSAKKKAASKSIARKTPAKKATKKAAAEKKTATKEASTKKTSPRAKQSGNGSQATAQNGAKRSAEGSDAQSAARRERRDTPAIFKLPTRRHAPVVFTIEDVREHLRKRKLEEKEEEATAEAKKIATRAPSVETTDAPRSGKRTAASLEDILGLTGGPATPFQRAVPPKWERYYQLLTQLRDSVKAGLMQHSSDTLKRSQKEDAGDISTSADAGTDNFDRDFALSLLSTEQEALKEIEAAIRRIHDGTYGVCEITGEEIAEERLEAVPFTRFSLEGQRQHESTARRRSNRIGGAVFAESSGDVSFGGDDDGDN